MGNTGLLLIRLAFGIYSAYYGLPKLLSGLSGWESLGGWVAPLGITFLPVLWGFLLAAIEFIGGVCFALGIFFRGASFSLFLRSFVYVLIAFLAGSGLEGFFSPLLHGAVYLGLFLTGEGYYGISRIIR